MPMARTLAAYPQARGNLAVVAVVDSSQPEFAFQFESAFAALAHFGIPFRVLDLAASPVTDAFPTDCRAILVFQEHLGTRLGADGQAAVLRAVETGAGLVSFDADLAGYGEPWLRAAGLAGAGRGGEVLPGGTPELGVRDNGHPITWYQDGESRKRLKVPVPTALTRPVAPDVTVLLEDGDGAPMLGARAGAASNRTPKGASPRRRVGGRAGRPAAWGASAYRGFSSIWKPSGSRM